MTAPREVLDAHTTLYERLKYPPKAVTDFYASFFTEEVFQNLERDLEQGGAMFDRWLQMLAPARDERDFLVSISRPLYGAPTYQVSTDIVDAVTATYVASAGQDIHLQAQDVPSETGFVWFDKPVVLVDAGGFSIATRAMSWGPQRIPEDFVGGQWPGAGFSRDGIRLTSYSRGDDTDSYTNPELLRLPLVLDESMPLTITHSSHISFGTRFKSRRHPQDDVTSDDIIHWAHTLWMFMGTEIVTTAKPQVERPARRRAQRALGSYDVNVVTLRRIRIDGEEVSPRDIDWTCRWVVQAFERHLDDYSASHKPHHAVRGPDGRCAVCGSRLAHVRAYIKGPADKPLKAVPETLFRVSR
jgi:hypothetical protein